LGSIEETRTVKRRVSRKNKENEEMVLSEIELKFEENFQSFGMRRMKHKILKLRNEEKKKEKNNNNRYINDEKQRGRCNRNS
jgi:hypothetical protein